MNTLFLRAVRVKDLPIPLCVLPTRVILPAVLVDVAQDVIVREDDCGTEEGLTVADIKDGNHILEPLEERLEGRYLLHDAVDPNTGEVIWSHEDMVTGEGAKKIVERRNYKQLKFARCSPATATTACAKSAMGATLQPANRLPRARLSA